MRRRLIRSQTAALISKNPKFNGSDDRGGRFDYHRIARQIRSCICIIQSVLRIVIQITNQLLVQFTGHSRKRLPSPACYPMPTFLIHSA